MDGLQIRVNIDGYDVDDCWLCGDTKIEYVFIDNKRTAVNCSECVKPQALPTGNN